MRLIIAEKPSVAQAIAAVIGADKSEKAQGYLTGNGYYVSWCVGHLVANAEPEQYDPALKQWSLDTLPIIPAQWKTSVIPSTERQYHNVKRLMLDKEVTEIICASDCGREGELIFRLVYNQAGCKKPVKRLWVSSLEEKELRRGLADLRDGKEFDNLYEAALCRSHADWLVGINFSRLYSIMYNSRLSVGRVQTPTVALVVSRDKEIQNFIPRPYWQIVADMGTWKAYTKVDKQQDADKIVAQCNHKSAYVSKLEQQNKKTAPPKLYNITALQRDANRLLGYTAQQTLTYLQSLYEKKLTTYPRTECEYLPSNMLEGLPERLAYVLQMPCIGEGTKQSYDVQAVNFDRVINDSKITDHHAIIPTGNLEDNIPEPEKNILRLISYRFLAAIAPPQEYKQTTVLLDIEGEAFKATGRAVTAPGFASVIEDMRKTLKGLDEDTPAEKESENIPEGIQEGMILEDAAVFSYAKETQPPKPYTEDSLLAAMANVSSTIGDAELKAAIKDLGLGTGATRAGIIETIIKAGYVERKKKQIVSTPSGQKLIEVVKSDIAEPKMTAEWEYKLEQIASGELAADTFMAEISQSIKSFMDSLKMMGVEVDKETFRPEREVIGICPRCGKSVVEYPKTFACESGKGGCGFVMWKEDKFFTEKKKQLGKATAAALLKSGKVKLKGLFSAKKGSTYDATVVLADTGKYVNYKLEFNTKN